LASVKGAIASIGMPDRYGVAVGVGSRDSRKKLSTWVAAKLD
jgi:hypothetical protein